MPNKRTTLNCNGRLMHFDRPLVMGILNVTPDSFYDGGHYSTESAILRRCETILEEGGSMIDIGAVSTRPGSEQINAEGEQKRLDFALSLIRKRFPDAVISLDTYRADIARRMVTAYGVDMINDISAGTMDARMFETVAALQVPYVLMHMQGTPETMQANPVYHHLMTNILEFFSDNIFRLRSMGVKDIIVDPGFGFGKTVAHNYALLRQMQQLEIFECPVLVGVSRKSMIYKILETDAQHALNGTGVVNTLALMHGADILRVHDVKEAVECVKIVQMYRSP
ncbi:MAG: dihydropteroate synthase [Bacteroidales bacterium]|jgi:dihydropteroate synthase|nr:dihydropteroate synthase [Bacteroidales bacterium]